jgi:hypothetical protein
MNYLAGAASSAVAGATAASSGLAADLSSVVQVSIFYPPFFFGGGGAMPYFMTIKHKQFTNKVHYVSQVFNSLSTYTTAFICFSSIKKLHLIISAVNQFSVNFLHM